MSRRSSQQKHQPKKEGIINQALEAVRNGDMNCSQAARNFGIERSTLYKTYVGKTQPRTRGNTGRETFLTAEDEKSLVDYCIHQARRGM